VERSSEHPAQPGKGRSGDRDWTRGKMLLCHNKAESEVQICANSFTGTTASCSQFTKFLHSKIIPLPIPRPVTTPDPPPPSPPLPTKIPSWHSVDMTPLRSFVS
jgi:hypothetical protein